MKRRPHRHKKRDDQDKSRHARRSKRNNQGSDKRIRKYGPVRTLFDEELEEVIEERSEEDT